MAAFLLGLPLYLNAETLMQSATVPDVKSKSFKTTTLIHPWHGKRVAYFGDSITDPKNKAADNKILDSSTAVARYYAVRICRERQTVERHPTSG